MRILWPVPKSARPASGDATCRCGLFAALWLLMEGCAAAVPATPVTAPPDATVTSPAPHGLGIVISSVRLSAAGYMIDVRYRITDPKLAAPLMDRRVPAYLIEPKSGARLMVPVTPTIGALRQTANPTHKDRSYFLLFANPGRFIKPGSQLSLHFGASTIDGLKVE